MILTSESPDAWKYLIMRHGIGNNPIGCVKYYDTEGGLMIRSVQKDGKWVEVVESSKNTYLRYVPSENFV